MRGQSLKGFLGFMRIMELSHTLTLDWRQACNVCVKTSDLSRFGMVILV